jgi:general secretion pathway protein I
LKRNGFTLVEILVALAIVAIALAAGMRALAQSTESASALKARTLALWVAQNRLAAAQVATPWPALGNSTGEAEEAGTRFVWQASVTTTPNPAFRRIDITIAEPQAPDYALARLTGFLGNPEPRP